MTEPLRRLQARALVDAAAADECATRYAATVEPTYGGTYSPRFLRRLAASYLAGLRGELPIDSGTNYERPLRRAYREGKELRDLLTRPAADLAGEELADKLGYDLHPEQDDQDYETRGDQ